MNPPNRFRLSNPHHSRHNVENKLNYASRWIGSNYEEELRSPGLKGIVNLEGGKNPLLRAKKWFNAKEVLEKGRNLLTNSVR